MTKEDLNKEILYWNPELLFAAENGCFLFLEIDAFNDHMYWNVKWHEDGHKYYEEFDGYPEARDYFLERVNNEENN